MRYLLLTIIPVLSLISYSAAGQGIVRGKVIDISTQEPLAGVYVIYGKALGTTTDKDGTWMIKTDPGPLSISFKFIGYKSLTKQVYIRDGETIELKTGLETETQTIDQIVVSADRIEQKIAELTVSLDVIKSDFLSGSHITDAQELINKVPGIEVLDGQTSIRGGSGFSYGVGSTRCGQYKMAIHAARKSCTNRNNKGRIFGFIWFISIERHHQFPDCRCYRYPSFPILC
jgi:hypothetical protein